ncbi:hypothetical protein XENORESO_016009 [Xenotaenia resolanae]|uniref:Secreted protein n=1 Tax=Xenotaenia resolanae TaxID=208358 RepID=A0ABV0WTC6_9TELE
MTTMLSPKIRQTRRGNLLLCISILLQLGDAAGVNRVTRRELHLCFHQHLEAAVTLILLHCNKCACPC